MSSFDANAILKALQKAGLKVNGVKILDIDDPSSWFFEPPLSDDDRIKAEAIVADVITPIVITPPTTTQALRDFLLLFTDDEYFKLATSADDGVVHGLAVLHAAPEFEPTAPWLFLLFQHAVTAKCLTQARSDALYGGLNPPV